MVQKFKAIVGTENCSVLKKLVDPPCPQGGDKEQARCLFYHRFPLPLWERDRERG